MLKKKIVFDTINYLTDILMRSYTMKRNRRFAVWVCVLMVLFTGCGQAGGMKAVESDTISVEKNGRITYYLVGDLDRDYYSLSELSAMAADEADRFNESAGKDGAAVVDRVEMLPENESKAMIVYQFDGYSSFNDFVRKFNKGEGNFFYGTVEEALNLGYTCTALKNVKDGTLITEEQLKQEGTKKLIITDEKAVIYCSEKAACLSDGAVLREDGSVDASAAEGTVYILMK